MFQTILADFKAFFSHPSTAVPAAVEKLTSVENSINELKSVGSALPDSNAKTAALDFIDKTSALLAAAINDAHVVEAVTGTATATTTPVQG